MNDLNFKIPDQDPNSATAKHSQAQESLFEPENEGPLPPPSEEVKKQVEVLNSHRKANISEDKIKKSIEDTTPELTEQIEDKDIGKVQEKIIKKNVPKKKIFHKKESSLIDEIKQMKVSTITTTSHNPPKANPIQNSQNPSNLSFQAWPLPTKKRYFQNPNSFIKINFSKFDKIQFFDV